MYFSLMNSFIKFPPPLQKFIKDIKSHKKVGKPGSPPMSISSLSLSSIPETYDPNKPLRKQGWYSLFTYFLFLSTLFFLTTTIILFLIPPPVSEPVCPKTSPLIKPLSPHEPPLTPVNVTASPVSRSYSILPSLTLPVLYRLNFKIGKEIQEKRVFLQYKYRNLTYEFPKFSRFWEFLPQNLDILDEILYRGTGILEKSTEIVNRGKGIWEFLEEIEGKIGDLGVKKAVCEEDVVIGYVFDEEMNDNELDALEDKLIESQAKLKE